MSNQGTGWFECASPNPEGTLAFYSAVFGTGSEGMDMGEMGTYHMFTSGGQPFGGIQHMVGEEWEGIPPHWNLYFHVNDIDKAMAYVGDNGGEIIFGPMDIPGGGKIAMAKDNQGTAFAMLWSPTEDSLPPVISWVEHMSPNNEKSKAFYCGLLGCDAFDQPMPEIGNYVMFHYGEKFFAGSMNFEMEGVPPHWLIYWETKDLNGCVEKVKSNGGNLIHGPQDIGEFGHIAVCGDNNGAVFGIHMAPTQ